jgi:putative cardiolipin synthase
MGAVLLLAGCAPLPRRPDLPEQRALPAGDDAALDRLIAPLEARHPGESGFRLASDGSEAFLHRLFTVRQAARSLDIQTYIWNADVTGAFFAQEVLHAADRGVRVRVLLDDVDARDKNDTVAALASHPRISVRVFNPFVTRGGLLTFLGEGALRFDRINRRMHNKGWIADNRFAVVGGRNIGDEYFNAGDDRNFIDLDFAMIGPVVRDVSASFDRYWNYAASYPIETLTPGGVVPAALDQMRKRLTARIAASQDGRYARAQQEPATPTNLIDGEYELQWSAKYRFVVDDPAKITRTRKEMRSRPAEDGLAPMVASAQDGVLVISPYFVPGREITRQLVALARAGRDVRILTNSLVANDVAAVHGGYTRHRRRLLRGGVQIWELKPESAEPTVSSFTGSSGASLHTKAFAVDGQSLFIGSYNIDPRSTWLNTEQGVLVENRTLTGQLERLFARQVSGEHAWQVQLDGVTMTWTDDKGTVRREPEASFSRRFQSWIARFLHLDAQL